MFFLISCFPGNSLVVSLGYLPGHIHAFWLIYKKMQAEERYGHGGFRCMYSIFLFLGILGTNNGPIHLHRPWFGPLWAALSIWSLPRPILSFTYAYSSTPPASSAVLRGNSSVLINFSVTPRTSSAGPSVPGRADQGQGIMPTIEVTIFSLHVLYWVVALHQNATHE